jgi:hypothetical protein
MTVRWLSEVKAKDDFGQPIDKVFIDGKTVGGPWGIMTPLSWKMFGVGKLGLGLGQKYELQDDGTWLKTEG